MQTLQLSKWLKLGFLDEVFQLPLSEEAMLEFMMLQQQVQQIELSTGAADSWTLFGNFVKNSSKKLYDLAFSHLTPTPNFKWIWKSKCSPRLKFFAWLMFVDRLNTKSMLQRRHLNSAHNTLYVLCDQQVEEDISHLFFGCGFAQSCWQRIGFN